MPLGSRFTATASHEEQHSLPTHRPAPSSRAVESTKQRSLPSSSFSSCLSLSLAVLFYLELSPFLSSTTAISPSIYAHANMLSLFVWRHALGALSESERIKREKDNLYLFLTLLLSLDGSTRSRLPMFSRRGFEGKKIFLIPFAEFLICYAMYSSH